MVARGPVAADTKESHNFVPYAGIKLTANGQRCLEHQSSGVDHGLQGHLSRGSQRQHLGVEIGDSHLRTQATRCLLPPLVELV
ncbi:uncharacterized protein LOC135098093 isoform X5 [Scylla paramamosain]|uniref:uncharacterized protein LOC135098093 isoform X5 n=1 Tax=Scylla paramamosain TaxID=85552 RepID=UPI003083D884